MALSAARDATIRARMAVSRPRCALRTEGVTHLRRDCIGSPVHVRCSEAEQAKACADKAVLPAVVINQPIAMITTVVFDRQALKAIQHVWPAQETAVIVTDGNLNLRPGESRKHKENSEPGLHGGLGLRLCEVNNPSKASDALGFRMFGHMKAQVGHSDQPRMKE
jgi:hypothetical protein